MTCVLRTARISNVEIVMCMINKTDFLWCRNNNWKCCKKNWRALYQPMYGNRRQSWILDFRPWISDSRYWIPTEYFVNGTYRFRIRIVSRIPDSLSCIPYSKAQDSEFRSKNSSSKIIRIPDSKIFQDSGFRSKNLLDSGFYKRKFPGFRIPDSGFRIPDSAFPQIGQPLTRR